MQPPQTTWPYPPAPKRLPPRKFPWPWTLVVGLVALALGVVGTLAVQKLTAHHGGGSTPAVAKTFVVSGRLHLRDPETVLNGCQGTGGYDDIQAGAQVVVYDAGGRQLAVGALGLGAEDATGCLYPFSILNVPVGDGGPYSVEVSHRGKIAFTQAQAGNVQMSLG